MDDLKYINNDWLISSERSYIQSRELLNNGFNHAFFTKKKGSNSPEKLINLISNNFSIHRLNQIHSERVIEASKSIKPPWPEADAIISTPKQNQSLWIYSADCIPVFFANKQTGQVAAAHAGWKGISKKLLKIIIYKLNISKSNQKDWLITLGPCISQDKYQVGSEVALKIYESIKGESGKIVSRKDKINFMLNEDIIRESKKDDSFFLDIRAAAIKQLLKEGLMKNQLIINKQCTFSEKNLFNSRRRDKVKSIQWNYILSR